MFLCIFVSDKYNYMEEKVKNMRITKALSSQKDVAYIYYKLICAIGNIALTETELNLLVHIALNGTISTPPVREAFIKQYDSSSASLNNMISKMQRKGVLVKDKNLKIRVRPEFALAFDRSGYNLNITMSVKGAEAE